MAVRRTVREEHRKAFNGFVVFEINVRTRFVLGNGITRSRGTVTVRARVCPPIDRNFYLDTLKTHSLYDCSSNDHTFA